LIKQILTITVMLFLASCSTPPTATKGDDSAIAATVDFASLPFMSNYQVIDKEYHTSTSVTVTEDFRTMVTNSLPNHETGAFPNPGNPNTISAQTKTYKWPAKPKMSGKSVWARETGVALNGVKFEPETAERFVCETGEVYRIEAIQNFVDLGLDFNLAHVQPTGEYHYHGVPTELIKTLDKGEDIILVGFANDGYPMYYSKSGKYKPGFQLSEESRTGDACSYSTRRSTMERELKGSNPDGFFVSDWTYNKNIGNLDECNGTMLNGAYAYFITDEYPYVGRCLKGEFTEQRPPRGGRPGGRRPGGPPPGDGQRPNGGHSHGPGQQHSH
jgi:hypothetical protein